jgi:methyl-accepting chemotaxis protein
MSKAQRVGNVYFAQFGLQACRGARGEGFEDSMADIRSAVDAIADVSRLISDDNRKLARLCNESSRRIAEVLSIIEAVALDSNLVALNAALEASREDRGRYDIALVASEVRALLSRSESATCELHVLLSDTVQKVEAGALLVEEVGLTLARSAGAVRQVTEILSEIGASGGASANDPLQVDATAD